jgi:hypothetical protein
VVAVLILRYLEAVMSVLPRMMLLDVLGAASGSAGFILGALLELLNCVVFLC